ncbi:hypothetical protein GCG21_09020 [Pseudactinotalea sp. HY160]|uniref:DUF7768 domain-containing protein n=1 Tax=Pseudactinotalea sp. HY160 TaxID=2654490 RepID=UPI00128E4B72|nr:hypothetical protein [Pseudactinotalea sp. HY160]MPV50144.1 hypothetical protein [Pseudactinotalea sp. HY160]
MPPRTVIIESPYAGNVQANIDYAREAMKDSLDRGEAPMLSHLLYTQVLDDDDPAERALGIQAGFAWRAAAQATIVYTDLGLTPGMRAGVTDALRRGQNIEYRSLR